MRFFRIDDSVEFTPVSFEDAHGLLWDPELGGVWCLGGSELALFDVELTGSGVAVTEREGYRKKLPTLYGHELQPMPGDTDSLLLSTGLSVYVYSKSTGVFSGGEGASALPGSARRSPPALSAGTPLPVPPASADPGSDPFPGLPRPVPQFAFRHSSRIQSCAAASSAE